MGPDARSRRSLGASSLAAIAVAAALSGCEGVSAPVGTRQAPAAYPVPDLAGVPNFARHGSEFRIGARALYVPAPGEDADILEHGTGDGFFIVYFPGESGELEGDFSFEVVLERSAHVEIGTGRAAEYWRACVGLRWMNAWSSPLEPFLSAGGSYSRIDVSGGDQMGGFGLYGGAGVEWVLGRAASALVEVKVHRFTGSGEGLAAVLALGAGVRF